MGQAQIKDGDDGEREFADELEPGTKLMQGQYEIISFLNAGGFGITYIARDSLDRKVVIKECFPGAFCRRSRMIVQARSRAHQAELGSIVRLFIQEARSLSKLNHPNIVGVHQVFEDNNTAYMALDFVDGRDLLDILDDPDEDLTPAEIKRIVSELLEAVGFIHDQHILHRDISPDNILIGPDRRPVLIDFGAAREQASKQSRVLSALRVVKDGYSPQEFYIAGSDQGPYSDLYALGASFYHLITGAPPPNSQARLAAVASGEDDPYQPLVGRIEGYDDHFLGALDNALAVLPKNRIQSASEWLEKMDGRQAVGSNVVMLDAAQAGPADDGIATFTEKKSSVKGYLLASVAAIVVIGVGIASQTDLMAPSSSTDIDAATQEVVASSETAQVAAPVTAPSEPAAAPDTADDTVVEDAAEPETEVAAIDSEVATVPTPGSTVRIPVEVTPRPAPRPGQDAASTASGEDALARAAQLSPDAKALENDPSVGQLASPATGTIATDGPNAAVGNAELAELQPAAREAEDALDAATDWDLTDAFPTLRDLAPTPPAATDPSDAPAFASNTQTALANDTGPVTISLPGALDDGLQPIWGANPEIAELNVGNELSLQETAESLNVLSAWRPLLPYTGLFSDTDGETRIFSVNGFNVNNSAEFNTILRNTLDPEGLTEVSLSVGTGIVGQDDINITEWVLPIVQETVLLNGLRFLTQYEDGAWVTRVTETPENSAGDLQVGDVILAFVPTAERMDQRTSLKDLFEREAASGRTDFSLAVLRDGTTWVATAVYQAPA